MKEKLKSKGLIIGIVVALIVVAIACVALFGKPSYKSQIKKFAAACESEEKMEKYVKKYVNLREYYAMQESEEPKDMDEEYKKAKKSDYKKDDFIDDVVKVFGMYVGEDGQKVKVEKIGKLEKIPDDKDNFLSTFSEIKGMKVAECTLKIDDEEGKCYALFYKGEMLMIMPDIQGYQDMLQ